MPILMGNRSRTGRVEVNNEGRGEITVFLKRIKPLKILGGRSGVAPHATRTISGFEYTELLNPKWIEIQSREKIAED